MELAENDDDDIEAFLLESYENLNQIERDPLTHLVRNCIDHGIELPAERIASNFSNGKRSTLKFSIK
ncbi:hypothetical protein [Scytonema hofmannii]|uniref:hypothetical protein n=1 Tax=Scytonema hofmannii TaxID=34078 RepID=UPI000476BB7F|nr:hypothetical protein [Scytonema hofmannii]